CCCCSARKPTKHRRRETAGSYRVHNPVVPNGNRREREEEEPGFALNSRVAIGSISRTSTHTSYSRGKQTKHNTHVRHKTKQIGITCMLFNTAVDTEGRQLLL
ncbi:unnamed protein product, partial [Ectocarpus sp. 8 AP-2014]